MKRQILSALGITILGVASYATTFMEVKTKDGEIVKFDVNDVDEVVFEDASTPVDTTPSSNHEYVDLGLPSGTLWATYNVGATKPEEYGDYFAWGETETKEVYDWSTYNWHDKITKYNGNDGLTTLLSEDDAATANWGSEWRMPTDEDLQELIEKCQYRWTEVNGVYGNEFTGKNGNSVFFPRGSYWSSSLNAMLQNNACPFDIDEKYTGWSILDDYSSNGCGFSVRAVRAK